MRKEPIPNAMLKPDTLRKGDMIAVVAPAGAVEAVVVTAGVRFLEDLGYRVLVGPSVFSRDGYLAGSDAERVADLERMFQHPDVRAIICARGGYGTGRLLPLLNLNTVRAGPKIFVGYSDVTFLLNHFVQRAGLVTFHGPMVTNLAQWPDGTRRLLDLLGGDRSAWKMAAAEIIQPGTAEGVLAGGCLSVVVALLGTPYDIDTTGRLLFLEDVNEKPYRIDRMLTQLKQAGKLDGVAGVVFGEMTGCVADPQEAVTVRDVIREAFAEARYPVSMGLPSGHGSGGVTLPLGVRARLAGERLTLLEPPLASI
jgi:muramoyltetrapeptide carboxypeptidase